MGTVWINSNNPHLLPRLFGHLKLPIGFKCPNANIYDLIQGSKMAPKIMKPFLAEVLAKTKNDEHFVKGTLGTLKSIYLNLVEITWC